MSRSDRSLERVVESDARKLAGRLAGWSHGRGDEGIRSTEEVDELFKEDDADGDDDEEEVDAAEEEDEKEEEDWEMERDRG